MRQERLPPLFGLNERMPGFQTGLMARDPEGRATQIIERETVSHK